MKSIIILLCILVSSFAHSVAAKEHPRCVLLFYHHQSLPVEVLRRYDWAILDPDNPFFSSLRDATVRKKQPKFLAYLSVGEIEPYRHYFSALKPYILGKNPTWGSYVVDLRRKSYLDFLLNHVVPDIAKKGFDGFLLDTLDSYELYAAKQEWKAFEEAEITFIQDLRTRYPEKLIVINRGFAIFDAVREFINGFLCEGLYHGLDHRKRYVPITEEERQFLLIQLGYIRDAGIPVIVVDYLPPRSRKNARKVAQQIATHGFIPYVTDREISTIGVSLCRD